MIKVFTYRNLHRNCWSVKALEGPLKGRVIYHADDVTLVFCQFKVSEAGRNRVLREHRKNVHAGVVGYLDEHLTETAAIGEAVTYNPYKYDSFVLKETEEPVHSAQFVRMYPNKEVRACF